MSNQVITARNNVNVIGTGEKTLLLAHGFGCDQSMWRFVTPALSQQYRLILFDYVGSGKSDLAAFRSEKYSSLEGYAEDILDICQALELSNVNFVGHSVSGMIGLIAAINSPQYFDKQVMVCPSPCFLNLPPHYFGGFEREDLEELINLMDKNYIGWANYLAPLVMGTSSAPELVGELSGSFCSTDPIIARAFAKATFFSDYRHILSDAVHPALILQSRSDALASPSVGEFVHDTMPGSTLAVIEAEGHCLHMTTPDVVADQIIRYV
ncbi:MAG: alpha/beta hydrolase [Pseudomonadota bacterium]